MKIRVLSSLKQDNDEERLEWKKLSSSLKVSKIYIRKSDHGGDLPILAAAICILFNG